MEKMKCPWCETKVDNRLDKLAEHIFKAHSDDIELCAWAEEELAKLNTHSKQGVIKKIAKAIPKYRGRPLDRIPPARQGDLPKRIRKQLPK